MMAAWRVVLVCALVAVSACRGPEVDQTDQIDPDHAAEDRASLNPEVRAQLDSGTAAFRAEDIEGALAYYRRVTELEPELAAGWFGVYMAENALGHADAAAEALERASEVVPGASLLHPGAADTIR